MLLLNIVSLDENCRSVLVISIEELFCDKTITQTLFSHRWPDFDITLRALSKLCTSLTVSPNFEIVRNIVVSKNFFEYVANVRFSSLRQLIITFLPKDNRHLSTEIRTMIDATDNFQQKIILLRLFYKYIVDETTQKTYKEFLSVNFLRLDTAAIYDFIFSEWISPTAENIEGFLKGILKMIEQRPRGERSFPDPVERKLECVYLLYINGLITDISILKELAEGRPHLQFLLSPKSFDYTQVDFSDYMWQNFARKKQYMKCFVAHKNVIVPKIKERIEKKYDSEEEKKILYGFLLDQDEIWEV